MHAPSRGPCVDAFESTYSGPFSFVQIIATRFSEPEAELSIIVPIFDADEIYDVLCRDL